MLHKVYLVLDSPRRMVETAAAANQWFNSYQGLIAAGVLPETDWLTMAAGVSAMLADAARTGQPLPQAWEPLVWEMIRRLLVQPTQLVGVRFESSGADTGLIRES
jgi:hypothetical protein